MGEERRSCAAAGVTEGARGTQGQAAQVALQGGPGFPGAERNGAETQLRPTRKRDVGAPRRRAAQRNAAEQRGSPVGWVGSNVSRRSFRRSLRRRDGRRRNCEAPLKRRPEPGAEAAAEQELQLRSLLEHLQPKRNGRRDSGGSGGRAVPEQVARKGAAMRAEINLPGNGRRRTAAQPAERRTRTGADGQVDRSAAGIEPEWQSARG